MTRSRIVVKGTIINNANNGNNAYNADYHTNNGFFNQPSYYDNNAKLRMSSVIEKGKIT